ncbi:isocitrate dehydrogenase [NAD] subunit gamma, mitochondrial-like [Euwallacea fornicatus]|uniref:isocitrate dehydrogenase [NAD] subunit gamma, mitochondrial-like n=1 Tax=Euwallacea fornicatus TaxID=995702 RepID=UPI00338DDBF0
MVLKATSRAFRIGYRSYAAKSHHVVLPADTFEGKIIPKTRLIDKTHLRKPVKYGGRYMVTMLPGADPGPKLASYVKDVFKEAHVPVYFEEIPYSGIETEAETLEFGRLALSSMHRTGVGIKGNIISPNLSINNVSLRQDLDLYVCVVHAKSYPHIKCKYSNMDVYICRQNTEGEYAMLEHSVKPGVVESLKIITEENTWRFADWCFNYALQKGRRKVTIVHKANIMKLSDGLFMKVIKEVSRSYPDLLVTDMIVDNATMQMVQDPTQFDIIVTPNLYGNILSNIACGLVGGAGLMSGKNFGPSCALFEAGSRHLTFLDENNLNPIAMLNASIDLLYYLLEDTYAELIHGAIMKTLSEDRVHTHDIGGTNSSDEVVESIKGNIRELLRTSHVKSF